MLASSHLAWRVLRTTAARPLLPPSSFGGLLRPPPGALSFPAALAPRARRSHRVPPMAATAGGRYAVLVTGHPPPPAAGGGGYGDLFVSLLREGPSEVWDQFVLCDGETLRDDQLAQYDGVVITGSKHDAHGPEEWVARLRGLVRGAHARKQRVLGVCFGHQLVANALGGSSGPAPQGWELGVKRVAVAAGAGAGLEAARGLPPTLQVLQVHRDQVLALPAGAVVLASSDKTPYEMYAVQGHMLCIQGHPEFTPTTVRGIIDHLDAQGLVTKSEALEAKGTLAASEVSAGALRDLCMRFLKGGARGGGGSKV